MKLTTDQRKAIYKGIYMYGAAYLVVTFIHFGIQYYDLDKIISNFVIGILILGIGWLIKQFYNFQTQIINEFQKNKKEVKELRTDFKATNKLVNDLLNKK